MHRSLASTLLAAAASLALSVTVFAQTAVPDTVSYQGRVTDASGNPVGAGSAVYRTAYFRIYDNASGGTRLWSEQQTITVANGEFSVLLGTGTVIVGETNANPLNAIFTAKDRFLGVTIDDGVAPAESEITPRQQLVTTAFAFRAKVAEAVASTAITTGMIANGAVTTNQLGDSAVSSSKIVDLTIVTADVANGAITAAKLGTDVGVWTTSGSNVYRAAGNVGVGTTTPTAVLSAGSAVGNNKVAVYDNGATARMGLGYQAGQLRVHTNATTDKISFLGTEAATTDLVTILGTGNVGIGTATPTGKLDVNGVINVFDAGTKSRFGGLASEANGTLVNFGINETRFGGATNTDQGGLLRVDSRAYNLFQFHGRPANATASTEIMSITSGGNVGIGSSTPEAKLDVGGNTDGAIQAILARGGDSNFRLVAQNKSAANNVGSEVSRFGMAYGTTIYSGLSFTRGGSGSDIAMALLAGGAERMRFAADGSVGIGTSSPSQAKLVVSGVSGAETIGNHGSLSTGGTRTEIGSFTVADASIRATGAIHAIYFRAVSDARIKSIQGRSDGASDLALLNQIEITNYTYIDRVAHGGRPNKRLIGQQVESVFPQAVSRTTDVIADIYKRALFKDGWVELATDLKVGERVRLLDDKAGEIYDVLEVQANRFRTNYAGKTAEVLVYGREVKDFRVVDYEAVAMLNVSATQQIKKEKDAEVKALAEKNAALAARVVELENKNTTLAAQNSAALSRLEALEKRFQAFARTADAAGNNN